MEQGLQRVLNLAKKTGDNVIVFDSVNPERSYVILAINKYEELLEEAGYQDFLTEEEMTDKINRDIEPWDFDDEAWELPNSDSEDFLPKDLFKEEDESTEDEPSFAEASEDEDVNYLYPTEDEFASLRTEDSEEQETETSPEAQNNNTIPEDIFEPEVIDESEDMIESEDNEDKTQFSSNFSSIGDLLEEKKIKGNNWEIPEDRQV